MQKTVRLFLDEVENMLSAAVPVCRCQGERVVANRVAPGRQQIHRRTGGLVEGLYAIGAREPRVVGEGPHALDAGRIEPVGARAEFTDGWAVAEPEAAVETAYAEDLLADRLGGLAFDRQCDRRPG